MFRQPGGGFTALPPTPLYPRKNKIGGRTHPQLACNGSDWLVVCLKPQAHNSPVARRRKKMHEMLHPANLERGYKIRGWGGADCAGFWGWEVIMTHQRGRG